MFICEHLVLQKRKEKKMTKSNEALNKVEEKFQHPELKPGEVFLNNYLKDNFDKLQYLKSRRFGDKVYDMNGREISGTNYHPVFVNEEDYAKYKLHLAKNIRS